MHIWKRIISTHHGPSLRDFMASNPTDVPGVRPLDLNAIPYLASHSPHTLPVSGQRKVFIETYGCQMNFNDTEIVLGILKDQFIRVDRPEAADVVLLMTCAIRENAESKIWSRLDFLQSLEQKQRRDIVVGVLGCMAERLKTELLEKKRNVDVVCGPDAYRDLPLLLQRAAAGQAGINVMLSMDETYADVAPVRLDPSRSAAFVSIMRGCNNMCAFCIVPFTRGRERSRPAASILEEARRLSGEGIREITLLGQNVNSYRDDSEISSGPDVVQLSRGFKTVYRPHVGGLRFVHLLDQISRAVPRVRIRFTSPHPKDFPDELLFLMQDRPNICKHIHLPAQSGSSAVLERMRRGYTREAYLGLVDRIRSILPRVSLSTDLIAGFCGETEEEHLETLSLLRLVRYDMAYMFAYSMREKTMAHRRFQDDVSEDVKQRRLREIIDLFYSLLAVKVKSAVGTEEVVLVEGLSKKNPEDLCGRSDGNRTIVFPRVPVPIVFPQVSSPIVFPQVSVPTVFPHVPVPMGFPQVSSPIVFPQVSVPRIPLPGDHVRVKVCSISGTTPQAEPIEIIDTTI